MLKQFISHQNQEIIWQAFSRAANLTTKEKEYIFKDEMGIVYELISANETSLPLTEWNKIVLQRLFGRLYRTECIETKEEKTRREFAEKQSEYERMTEKKVVAKPEALLPEIYEDKIQNMDEAVKKYENERKLLEPIMDPKQKELNIYEYAKSLEMRIAALEKNFSSAK